MCHRVVQSPQHMCRCLREETMKNTVSFMFGLTLAMTYSLPARGAASCSGVFSTPQLMGFSKFFTPERTAGLSGGTTLQTMSKTLSAEQVKALTSAKPIIASETTLTAARAKLLQEWLNENANAS